MADCLIGLGSNLGDRRATMEASIHAIGEHPDLQVIRVSGLYQTRAVGGPGEQPAFLNGAARIETTLAPEKLLKLLLRVEERLGRLRGQRWDARTIDLDLLLYGDLVLETPQLVLPHPRMAFRRFTLDPAVEIASDMLHPTTGWNLEQLLYHLTTAPDYVALVGIPGVGKTRLARSVARLAGCRLVTASLPASRLAAFRVDPSGRAWDTQLEFLRLRGSRLQRRDPTVLSERCLISDFWLDQTLVYGQYCLPETARTDFERHWSDVKARSPLPKLLVFVETAGSSAGTLRPWHSVTEAGERLSAALLRQVSLPRQAPLLKVDTSNFTWAVNEVRAALEAMQHAATRVPT